MAVIIRMPAALAGAAEGAIQSWLVHPGQSVEVGTPLAEIETEKAVVEYAAEAAGTVGRLLAEPGAAVEVGEPIAVLLAAGEGEDAVQAALAEAGVGAAVQPEPAPSAIAPAAAVPDAAVPDAAVPDEAGAAAMIPAADRGERIFASPIVRRLARERGLDLDALTGSGPGGRIVRRDLDRVPGRPAAASGAAAEYIDVPLTGMRRAIARRLTESKTTVPHFYVTAHLRVDALLALRRELNEVAERKLSVNDFVLKAVAGALRAVPAANASWLGDAIRRFEQVDLAVAVAIGDGLLTPVIRGAESRSLQSIAAEVAELAERARAGRLQQHELEGGGFAVSNLGMYGVDEFSAILNPPQSGILAVGAAKQRPVVVDGELAVGTVMTVTLSADHRVIDGAIAAQWMAAFAALIEHPVRLLL